MKKYTYYIVTRSRDHHYPVLMANNGKAALNEPCRRAGNIEQSLLRFADAILFGEVTVERIDEKEFKEKFPRYTPNKGGRKKQTKPPTK